MALKKKAIIKLFERIAQPYKDKEGGLKLDLIQQYLNEHGIENEWIPGQGLIVNKQDNPRIVLVSHIDLIRKFQKGFANCKVYEITETPAGRQLIKGALDNTITNAVAILSLMEIMHEGVNDVELFLSEGEEVGMKGMKAYLKANPEKSSETFFINLDVTNEGWGHNASVEYDEPNFKMYKQTMKLLEKYDAFSTGYRVCDDIDAVNSADCFGYSYCLPTRGTIHSYRNEALVDTLVPYGKGLIALLKKLKHVKKMKSDFSGYNLSMADDAEDLDSLKKKIEEKRKAFATPSFGKRGGSQQGSLFDYEDYYESKYTYPQGFDETPFDIDPTDPIYLDEEESFQQRVTEFLAKIGIDNDLVLTFIFERIALGESFGLEDFANVVGEKTEAEDMIYLMESEGLVKEIMTHWYKFAA
jgi:hypothetical protein